uniref:sensor histidine kinase n=1 Tax=Acetatifactor sp. TaxID=1872090 RepID=UPI004056F084
MWIGKHEKEKLKEIDKRCCEALAENLALKEKLSMLQHVYEQQLNSTEEMERIYAETRRLKHDMRNHLMVIGAYLSEERLEEAKTYTSEIIDKMELEYSYISSGNALMNYILNEKFSMAKSHGVYIKADVENLSFSQIAGIDFSAILGNVLDNALEAAGISKEKQLWVTVRRKRGYDTIKISNSIDESVLETNPLLKTSKADDIMHGLGSGQIRKIVEKYDGILDIWEENEMFHVQIMFEHEKNDTK